MSTNFEKISYIIDNNIKYKLKHRNLPRVNKSQCSYFLHNGLINTNLQFDSMREYYKILCVLKGLKRVGVIRIFEFDKPKPNLNDTDLRLYTNIYKIFVICSKLGLKIIYINNYKKLSFEGIIFHKNNSLIAMMYYFALNFKKNKKYIFAPLELDIIKEFLNNNNRKIMIHYINKYIIVKNIPNKLKYLFNDIKNNKNNTNNKSYKQDYINYLKIIHDNKEVMESYYNEIIKSTIKKYNKYVDSKEFKLFMKKYNKNIKTFDITQDLIFSEIKHSPAIKNKISNELDKIK
jgi:hypothetical protein